jgi:hypothetical protein
LLACLLSALTVSGIADAARVSGAAMPADKIFVANLNANTVSVYPIGKFGNVKNLVTDPGLLSPNAIARDGAGHIYVANYDGDSITEYARGASGNPNPKGIIR